MVTLSNARVIAACVTIGVSLTLSARPAAQPAPSERPLLRIGTTLVEIDAIVTDKHGRHIDDLTAADFELHQDGRKQKITSVRYVLANPASQAQPANAAVDHNSLEGARRIMAIVLDDLNMSFASMNYTRKALLELIDTKIEPGDRVAVIRVGHEGQRTEWFTSDKEALRKTVSALRYNVMSSPQNDAFKDSIAINSFDLEQEAFTVGGLGAVNSVVRAMKAFPGRKAVVLATDGFALLKQEDGMLSLRPGVIDAIRRLVDDANRSFVTLYTVDTRRLSAVEFSGTPLVVALRGKGISANIDSNSDGPWLIADAGGGLYLRNSNDLAGLFTKVLDDQRGYYLLAYEPDDQTFAGKNRKRPPFHNVDVKVSRSGLRVRARAGFFGVANDDPPPPEPARAFGGS